MQGSVVLGEARGGKIYPGNAALGEVGSVGGEVTKFAAGDIVVKVKEPNAREVGYLRPGQVLFTYLHLAAAPDGFR